jgi:hypothetical protein
MGTQIIGELPRHSGLKTARIQCAEVVQGYGLSQGQSYAAMERLSVRKVALGDRQCQPTPDWAVAHFDA